jgi:transcriptional regulator with XRE-family HTH domain
MPARIGNPQHRRRHFIREWREFRGFSQQDLADRVHTTKTTISRIENGINGYTQDGIEAIGYELGTHPGVLLMREPTESDRYADTKPESRSGGPTAPRTPTRAPPAVRLRSRKTNDNGSHTGRR